MKIAKPTFSHCIYATRIDFSSSDASSLVMENKLLFIFKSILSIYFVIGLVLFIFQRKFIYFPTLEVATRFDVENFSSGEETLKIIKVKAQKPSQKALIYFGGNAETVALSAPEIQALATDCDIYLFNYRGYAGSTGKPTQSGNFTDALAFYDYLQKHYQTINIIGKSLGSGVASYLASKRTISKLALITPFDSLQAVAQSRYPIYPMSLLLKDKYLSYQYASNINAKTFILMAENDLTIPLNHSRKLIKAFKNKPKSKIIKNTNHSSISLTPEYWQVLQDFFKD